MKIRIRANLSRTFGSLAALAAACTERRGGQGDRQSPRQQTERLLQGKPLTEKERAAALDAGRDVRPRLL